MGTPRDLFLPCPESTLGRYGRNTLMHMRGHEHFILTKFRKHKFRKHPSWGSVVKADYVFPYIHMH